MNTIPKEINEKLEPCPCCGAEAELRMDNHREYKPTFSIICTGCSLRLMGYDNIPKTIEAWNKRSCITTQTESESKTCDDCGHGRVCGYRDQLDINGAYYAEQCADYLDRSRIIEPPAGKEDIK